MGCFPASGNKDCLLRFTGQQIESRYYPYLWLAEYIEKAERFPFCFGLHLALQEPDKTVCIVESAKTAVVCSIEYPGYCWLAVGSLSWLNPYRLVSLQDRNLILVPDAGAGEQKWIHDCAALQREGFRAEVVTLNLPNGADIADLSFASTTEVYVCSHNGETITVEINPRGYPAI